MAIKNIDLDMLSEEELLNLRIKELPLSIERSWLADCVADLYRELDDKGVRFKPVCYLSDEWLAPDKEPLVGIPFFLAHPALMKLEKKMMIDVEGGSRPWCMKLLRHETGHALNYAYKLYRRKKWQKIFGRFSQDYEDTYRFRPYSKGFVRHLEDYYAQYHPDEDFAETFAVWLTPDSNWQERYKGWKAIAKLNYVQELMGEIKNKEPLVKQGKKYWQACRMSTTLKNFYRQKKRSYAQDLPDFHDTNLKKIFTSASESKDLILASTIIRRHKKSVLDDVARWTGERKYIIDTLLNTIIQRCKELKLATDKPESVVMSEISVYITTLVMNYLYTGWFGKYDAKT